MDAGTPDAAAIRRALAECMTLADIDDLMGWATGTARGRRWLDRSAGGLPPADAELAGVPLWFRTTVTRWRATAQPTPPAAPPGPSPEPDDEIEDEGPVEADGGAGGEPTTAEAGEATEARDGMGTGGAFPAAEAGQAGEDSAAADVRGASESGPTRPVPRAGEAGHTTGADGAVEDDEAPGAPGPDAADGTAGAGDTTGTGRSTGAVEVARAVQAGEEPVGGEPARRQTGAAGRPRSGFAVSPGQDVLALIHGEWHPAVVVSRDRRTVVVDYQLGPGPLDARRQRVGLDRVRLPDPGARPR